MRFILNLVCSIPFSLFLISNLASGQDWLDEIGWRELLDQQGGVLENGAGIDASQVEAPTANNFYMPDEQLQQFEGKTFFNVSNLNSGISSHATSVGRFIYGSVSGIAGGVTMIYNYEANHWLNSVLGFQTRRDPASQPYQVQNHSWIGTDFGPSDATNILQRADFTANQENLSIVVGTSNRNAPPPELLVHGYNVISVGKTIGDYGHGPTTFYGAGRMKPEIVAPKTTGTNSTSIATAVISSAAEVLREAGGGANGNVTNATQNEVIKALILAGATKEEFPDWDRTPTRPLDDVTGAGEINILHSYNILKGGEFDGTPSAPGVAADLRGWDYSESISPAKYYSFDVPHGATDVSILLTWNIDVVDLVPENPDVFTGQATLADMNLELLDLSGTTIDSSFSAVDNIEHIYIAELPPGQYTLRVDSDMDYDYGLAWRMTEVLDTTITPVSFEVTTGNVLEGGLPELAESDNQYLVLNPRFLNSRYQLIFTVDAISPTDLPTTFEFTLESNVLNFVGRVDQKIELFNYISGQFEVLDNRDALLADVVVTVRPEGDVTRFVQAGTRAIKARISYQNSFPFWVTRIVNLYLPFRASVDHIFWTVK